MDAILFRELRAYHLDFRLRESGGTTLTNDLQIHVLELPKYDARANNELESGALEKWLYFLGNAQSLSVDEVSARLKDDEFVVAAGVLEMIARTPEDRIVYDNREKARRDEAARLQGARREGRDEGRIEGRIELLQQLLDLPCSSADELAAMDRTELNRLAAELERKLRERHAG